MDPSKICPACGNDKLAERDLCASCQVGHDYAIRGVVAYLQDRGMTLSETAIDAGESFGHHETKVRKP